MEHIVFVHDLFRVFKPADALKMDIRNLGASRLRMSVLEIDVLDDVLDIDVLKTDVLGLNDTKLGTGRDAHAQTVRTPAFHQ
jgi:hypothetical protein